MTIYIFLKQSYIIRAIIYTGDWMKKWIVIIVCFFLFGCQAKTEEINSTDKQYKKYKAYIETLDKQKHFISEDKDFSTRIIVNETNKGNYRYDIIIDNPTITMYNIKIIASIDDSETVSYPTIGILDEESFALIPGVIDKTKNIYKGINLSGISSKKEATVKIYITFTTSEDDSTIEERFIQV